SGGWRAGLLVCVVAALAGGHGVGRLALPPPATEAAKAASVNQGDDAVSREAGVVDPGDSAGRRQSARDDDPAALDPAALDPATVPTKRRWRLVLERLDRAREHAWRSGRVGDLRQVWTATSSGLAADRQMLRAWLARGHRVAGVAMAYGSVRMLHQGRHTVVLRCVDRLDRAVGLPSRQLSTGPPTLPLPTDRPTRHHITLVRTDGGWRLSEVRVLG
ncbi:MAG: hypothetical protein ACRDO2_10250, partial [Nocardioidaceae bacterium]